MALMVSFSAFADDTWTIVGDNTDVLGSSWNVEDTGNDMTFIGDNVWRLVKSVNLASATTLEYKVAKDHSWDTNYGKDELLNGDNISVSLEAGTYDLVFTFHSDTHALSANYSYTIVAGDAIINGNDAWTTTATANDMIRVNYDLYKLTVKDVELTAGDYEYKVIANHAWSVWEVPSSGNQTLTISEDGTYDIIYTLVPSTSTLTAVALKQNTYTIVGDAPLVSGDAWTPSNHANDMTKDADNVKQYTLQLTGRKIPAGTYYYKTVYNEAWWPCVPNSNNASLVVAEDGVYTIDYTLTLGDNANGSDATLNAVATKTASATYPSNWLVVGSEGLTGYNWDVTGAHNVMTENGDGTVSLTFSNLALTTDGTYKFKVVHNFYEGETPLYSYWYPTDDQVVSVSANGNYDVTITYNPATNVVTQSVTVAEQTYTVAIADPGWGEVWAYVWTGETPIAGVWPGTQLTKSGDNYVYTYTGTTMPSGLIFNNGDGNGIQTPDLAFVNGKTYTDVWTIMGATQNASWEDYATEPIFGTKWTADVAGNDMTSADGKTWTWTKNNVALEANTHIKYKATYSHCGTDYVVGSTGGDGMKVLDILIAGKYDITFTFTRDGNSSAVTATATKTSEAVTIGASGWATTVTNSALDFSGLTESFKAYTATLDGTTVSLNEVADVQAETGLVLKGTAGTYYAPVITESETAKGDLQFSSIYSFTVNDDGSDYYCYGLHLVGENAQFAKIKNGQVIPAQKAFLMVGKSVGARELSIAFGDETTSISNLNANGNLNDNATRYNLAGQKVSDSYKGIVIVNGKKYINK